MRRKSLLNGNKLKQPNHQSFNKTSKDSKKRQKQEKHVYNESWDPPLLEKEISTQKLLPLKKGKEKT